MTVLDLHGRLEQWIARHYADVTNLAITPFAAASSGTSNETKLFTLNYNAPAPRSERLVLRTAPAGGGYFPVTTCRSRPA